MRAMAVNGLAERIDAELRAAEAARSAGNEGRARVCARRAAGLAAGSWLARSGEAPHGSSVYDRLRRLQRAPGLPDELRRAAARLTTRVTEGHTLPHPEDPLEDARRLIAGLLGQDAPGGKG